MWSCPSGASVLPGPKPAIARQPSLGSQSAASCGLMTLHRGVRGPAPGKAAAESPQSHFHHWPRPAPRTPARAPCLCTAWVTAAVLQPAALRSASPARRAACPALRHKSTSALSVAIGCSEIASPREHAAWWMPERTRVHSSSRTCPPRPEPAGTPLSLFKCLSTVWTCSEWQTMGLHHAQLAPRWSCRTALQAQEPVWMEGGGACPGDWLGP